MAVALLWRKPSSAGGFLNSKRVAVSRLDVVLECIRAAHRKQSGVSLEVQAYWCLIVPKW